MADECLDSSREAEAEDEGPERLPEHEEALPKAPPDGIEPSDAGDQDSINESALR